MLESVHPSKPSEVPIVAINLSHARGSVSGVRPTLHLKENTRGVKGLHQEATTAAQT